MPTTPGVDGGSAVAPTVDGGFGSPVTGSDVPQGCGRFASPLVIGSDGYFRFDAVANALTTTTQACAPTGSGQFPLVAVSRNELVATLSERWELRSEVPGGGCTSPTVLGSNLAALGYPVGMATVRVDGQDSIMAFGTFPLRGDAGGGNVWAGLVERREDGKVVAHPMFASPLRFGGLTGTADGRLFAGIEGSDSSIHGAGPSFDGVVELDPKTGALVGAPVRVTTTLVRDSNRLPMVFWGGSLWFFLGEPDATNGLSGTTPKVLRYDFATKTFATPARVAGAPKSWQGAAVSTCAPTRAPR
ncbi:MAG: hypothetical protein U0169_05265 [Polyangiaceae bacterium]